MALNHKIGFSSFGYESIGKLFPAQEGGGVVMNGILPENFVSPGCGYVAVPIEIRPGERGEIGRLHSADGTVSDMIANPLTVYARLAPGVTPQLAEQMLSGTSSGVQTTAGNPPPRSKVKPLSDIIVNEP